MKVDKRVDVHSNTYSSIYLKKKNLSVLMASTDGVGFLYSVKKSRNAYYVYHITLVHSHNISNIRKQKPIRKLVILFCHILKVPFLYIKVL